MKKTSFTENSFYKNNLFQSIWALFLYILSFKNKEVVTILKSQIFCIFWKKTG
jgi:hypothetical protein